MELRLMMNEILSRRLLAKIAGNVPSIGDGWEFEKQKFSMSKKVDSSNNVEFGTSAQLLPMQCYGQYGF